jgi:hypothetical protein
MFRPLAYNDKMSDCPFFVPYHEIKMFKKEGFILSQLRFQGRKDAYMLFVTKAKKRHILNKNSREKGQKKAHS